MNAAPNVMWAPLPASISAKKAGTHTAAARLLSTEMATRVAMLPPSMAVMTGAAVAVGHRMQIMAPPARSRLTGASSSHAATDPATCTPTTANVSRPMRNSEGLMRQKVISSIVKIRYGARNCTESIASWKSMPHSMASGSIQGFSRRRKSLTVIVFS